MLKTHTVTQGNRAVIINDQGNGFVWACLYVNVRQGIDKADITPIRWTGRTAKGAEKWAAKQLARAA